MFYEHSFGPLEVVDLVLHARTHGFRVVGAALFKQTFNNMSQLGEPCFKSRRGLVVILYGLGHRREWSGRAWCVSRGPRGEVEGGRSWLSRWT